MNEKLTPEQIVSQIEYSFPGYTVVAEIWDYRFRFRFQVRSAKENSILLTVPDRLIHEFNAKPQLDQLIAQAREMIDKKANASPATFQTSVGSELRKPSDVL